MVVTTTKSIDTNSFSNKIFKLSSCDVRSQKVYEVFLLLIKRVRIYMYYRSIKVQIKQISCGGGDLGQQNSDLSSLHI